MGSCGGVFGGMMRGEVVMASRVFGGGRSYSLTSKSDYLDVLVVGGGIAGATMAKTLDSLSFSGLKIGLIEMNEKVLNPPLNLNNIHKGIRYPDSRTVSLSQISVNLLRDIGIWDVLERGDGEYLGEDALSGIPVAFNDMEVWDTSSRAALVLNRNNELTANALGYNVEASSIQRALFKLLTRDSSSVRIMCPDKIKDILNPPIDREYSELISIETEQGRLIETSLLVVADGAKSPISSLCKIPTSGYGYNQMGIVTIVEHSRPNYTAWQRFLPDGGILAVLPMWSNFSSIVWSVDLPIFESIEKMSDETFEKTLQNHVSELLPRMGDCPLPLIEKVIGNRRHFPLQAKMTQKNILPRMALIGDASHVVHPLVGHGLNMGLRDVISLSNTISDAIYLGTDIGSLKCLKMYQNETLFYNAIYCDAIDKIWNIFRIPSLETLRTFGMDVINNFRPLQTAIVKVGMGLEPINLKLKL